MEDQDAELLRALQDEHGEALFAHAVRLSGGDRQRAEDLVQETLLRAWRYPEALDPERGAVRSWLFTTARNLAIDAWRRRSVRVGEVVTDMIPEPPPSAVMQPSMATPSQSILRRPAASAAVIASATSAIIARGNSRASV